MRGGDQTHWLHATKQHEARGARSRGPNNTGFERLTATRSRTTTRRVAIDEGRAAGAQVADLVRELGLEGRLEGRRRRGRARRRGVVARRTVARSTLTVTTASIATIGVTARRTSIALLGLREVADQ
jgi:hypothetical protein